MIKEKEQVFFEEFVGEPATEFKKLAQSGSARANYAAQSSGQKYIVTKNNHLPENESFFYFSQIFSELHLNTPEIFKISDDRKMYVQEFLGENTLSEIIEKEGLSERVQSLVKKTLHHLFQLQIRTRNAIDYSQIFEYEEYDELPILNDLFYFKSFIVDLLEIPYHKAKLVKEFKTIISEIENLEPKGLMIRDFQARNIMVDNRDEVFFIDYQSAMKGPLMYDVISFLFQAKANFPEDFKSEMLNYYFSLWKEDNEILQLKSSVKLLQLIRFMQVLGAYGFRGLVQRKPHFLKSLSQGIDNLSAFSQNWDDIKNYPELKEIIRALKTDDTYKKIEQIIS